MVRLVAVPSLKSVTDLQADCIQLAAIHAYGLLESDQLERFTERTRATIESIAKEFTR